MPNSTTPNATNITHGSFAAGESITRSTYYGAPTVNSMYSVISNSNYHMYVKSGVDAISIDCNGREYIRLDKDGKITWDDTVTVDKAAVAFSNAMSLGVELKLGLTVAKKCDIRNELFEEIIKVAEEEGPLDATKLAFMLRSCKIMDKLKGIN